MLVYCHVKCGDCLHFKAKNIISNMFISAPRNFVQIVGQCIKKEACVQQAQVAGIKYFPPPINYDHIEFPENRKLKYIDRIPQYPPNVRPPTMQKRLKLMRGPELVHNQLLHKQFGIVALIGGRMRWNHFEMARMYIGKKLDTNRMFAEWRVDPPWQAVSRKGQGQRMGGGKAPIDHYVSPLKAGRIILEIGGKLEWPEARQILRSVAVRLPFKAEAVNQEMMEKRIKLRERLEKENLNPYTMKYVIQNNLGGCNNWLSFYDYQWYGEHL